jgi:heat shock protein HtpX
MTIYSQIDKNKRNTFIIMVAFTLFVSGLSYFLGEIFVGRGAGAGIFILGFLFSTVSSISSFYFSDKMVLAIAGAKKVSREQAPQVYGLLENLCIGAGLKKIPDLYVIEDSAPNAFATGRDPEHSVVAVTTGLVDKLSKRELEGVIAHELSHVKNYDIRLMAVAAILVGSITLIVDIFLRGSFSNSDNDRKMPPFIILIGFVLALLSPVIAQLIKLAISRNREYLADASAALITRDPEGLALALEKISSDREPLEVANEATAHMYISNPLKKGQNAAFFANLFNTHPPVGERIKRLRSM